MQTISAFSILINRDVMCNKIKIQVYNRRQLWMISDNGNDEILCIYYPFLNKYATWEQSKKTGDQYYMISAGL